MLPRLQLRALRESLERRGLCLRDKWVFTRDYAFEAGGEHGRTLIDLPQRPPALICSDDMIAIGAIGALSRAGLPVPGDLATVEDGKAALDRVLAAYRAAAIDQTQPIGARDSQGPPDTKD